MDKYLPFNRTNMELKLVKVPNSVPAELTFNRTNMELKHVSIE